MKDTVFAHLSFHDWVICISLESAMTDVFKLIIGSERIVFKELVVGLNRKRSWVKFTKNLKPVDGWMFKAGLGKGDHL